MNITKRLALWFAAVMLFTTSAMAEYTFVVPQKAGQGTTVWAEIVAAELEPFLGEKLNSKMVSSGQAVAYRKYSKNYIDHEEIAKNKKIGIWSGEFDMPWEWRKKNK